MKLSEIHETARFEDSYRVTVSGYGDQPILEITGVGFIRLFLSGGFGQDIPEHWVVHMIKGEAKGVASVLYFAALLWIMKYSDIHLLASDSTLSPDALRARNRLQSQYADYLYIMPHPYADGVKVHRGDNSGWRRKATTEEATMWRLKKMPPFEYEYINA